MKMDLKINQFNLNTGILGKVKNIIFSNNVWHKIQVENVKGLDRDVVLKTLMNAVHPLDFIPVNYELSGKTATFLIKNCGHAIQKLCSHNLVILNPQDPTKPFKLTIHPNYAKAADLKVNVQNDVVQVLNKRYNADTNVLNLEQFYKDPDLTEFCSLSQPKLMFYILHLSKSFTIKKLILSNNEISSLKPIEAIYNMRCLTTLDLRNNNIKDSSEIAHLKNLNIVELWLDGNPICDEYDELSYGRSMKEMIEKLEKLDGHIIYPKGFLAFRRNFLCNTAGLELVDQFLEHYFTLYDGQNRSPLDLLYHNDALFSITCNYLGYQSTSVNARLSHYKKITRNIKQISDFSKNIQFLYKGPYNIMKVLCLLPKTEHDPYTFTVDLMTYTETTAVLVVTGVFREPAESLIDVERLFGFTRTFVLLAGSNGEYCIVNEQLHVFNATSAQVLRAFKVARVQRPNIIQIPLPQNLKEQSELVEAFKVITGLNSEWSKNCLEDCQYDLKKALTLFVDLFKIDKITENAFIGSSDPPAIEVEKRNNISQHEAVVNKMPEISKLPTNISGTIGNINAQSQYKVSSNDPKLHLPTYEIPTTSTVVSPPIKDEVLDLFESISNEGLSKYSDEKSIKDEVLSEKKMLDLIVTKPTSTNRKKVNIKFPGIEHSKALVMGLCEKEKIVRDQAIIFESAKDKVQTFNQNVQIKVEPQLVTQNPQQKIPNQPVTAKSQKNKPGPASQKVPQKKIGKREIVLSKVDRKVVKKKVALLKQKFSDLFHHKDYKGARDCADTILSEYGIYQKTCKEVFETYYLHDVTMGRAFVERCRTRLPQKTLLDYYELIIANCEVLYGTASIADEIYDNVIKHRPLLMQPRLMYVEHLLRRKKIEEARAVMSSTRSKTKIKITHKKYIYKLEQQYNCKLW